MEQLIYILSIKAAELSWATILWMWDNPEWAIPLLLVEFIVSMKLYHWVKDAYPLWARVLKVPLAIWFLPQDVFVQIFIMSFLMLEVPPSHSLRLPFSDKRVNFIELTVTARMRRYEVIYSNRSDLNLVEEWRYLFKSTLCPMLNWADEAHC